jgi:hypothetical protein
MAQRQHDRAEALDYEPSKVHAPDDEKTDDLDPEEHYGWMTADRQPKPAFTVVAAMYAARPETTTRNIPLLVVISLALVAIVARAWAVRSKRHQLSPQPPSLQKSGTRADE